MGVGVTGGNALTNPSESGVLSPNGGEGEGDSPCVTERSGFSVWLGGGLLGVGWLLRVSSRCLYLAG